jgi:hypothetical protein
VDWIGPPHWHDVWLLYHDYFGATFWSAVIVVGCALVAVLPPAGWWRGVLPGSAARTDKGRPQAPNQGSGPTAGISLPSVALPLLLVPASMLLIESRLLPPLYQDRYVFYGEPAQQCWPGPACTGLADG